MKTVGLIGGTGWVSSVEYYRYINEGVNKRLGGLEFARCILYSMNYGDIARLQKEGGDGLYPYIENIAQQLISSGAEGLVLCANTLHKFYNQLSDDVNVPVIHIARATAKAIHQRNFSKVGLLGTIQTMEGDFYTEVLKEEGIETLVPEKEDRLYIDDIIVKELFKMEFNESTRKQFLHIMQKLQQKGAEGIILGCTEIPLLIQQQHTEIPLFDTLKIHADVIVDFAIN